MNPDIYRKYNLRSKIDFTINRYATLSNNTSFYGSQYTFQGKEASTIPSVTADVTRWHASR
jgi:hypothetical protein